MHPLSLPMDASSPESRLDYPQQADETQWAGLCAEAHPFLT